MGLFMLLAVAASGQTAVATTTTTTTMTTSTTTSTAMTPMTTTTTGMQIAVADCVNNTAAFALDMFAQVPSDSETDRWTTAFSAINSTHARLTFNCTLAGSTSKSNMLCTSSGFSLLQACPQWPSQTCAQPLVLVNNDVRVTSVMEGTFNASSNTMQFRCTPSRTSPTTITLATYTCNSTTWFPAPGQQGCGCDFCETPGTYEVGGIKQCDRTKCQCRETYNGTRCSARQCTGATGLALLQSDVRYFPNPTEVRKDGDGITFLCRDLAGQTTFQCDVNTGVLMVAATESICDCDCFADGVLNANNPCNTTFGNGQCNCVAPWRGPRCDQRNCTMDSDCAFNASDPATAGSQGLKCEMNQCVCNDPNAMLPFCAACRAGFFRPTNATLCQMCNCMASAMFPNIITGACDTSTGRCLCREGWSGVNCEISGCPNDCSGRGRCVLGVCQCDTGFTGRACNQTQLIPSPGCAMGATRCNKTTGGVIEKGTCVEDACLRLDPRDPGMGRDVIYRIEYESDTCFSTVTEVNAVALRRSDLGTMLRRATSVNEPTAVTVINDRDDDKDCENRGTNNPQSPTTTTTTTTTTTVAVSTAATTTPSPQTSGRVDTVLAVAAESKGSFTAAQFDERLRDAKKASPNDAFLSRVKKIEAISLADYLDEFVQGKRSTGNDGFGIAVDPGTAVLLLPLVPAARASQQEGRFRQ
ncbi:MAG: hypothetical protein MHM6MM_005277 [Cercozoa sp. M6MM]